MKYTPNYNFKKPEATDTVNINDISESFELVDAKLKETQDKNIALEEIFEELVINAGSENAEIVVARGTEVSLPVRLDKFSGELADIPNQTYVTEKARQIDLNATNEIIADNYAVLDTKINSQASGSPKGTYATLALLTAAFPTGNANIYVVTADGKWYFWNGSAWTVGGTYQATGLEDGGVTYKKINPAVVQDIMALETKEIQAAKILNQLNAIVGMNDGTLTIPFTAKLNCTTSYQDNPIDSPIEVSKYAKMVRINYDMTNANAWENYAYYGRVISLVDTTSCFYGCWYRKADLLAVPRGTFEYYSEFRNVSDSNIEVITLSLAYVDMTTKGYTKTVTSGSGLSCVAKVETIYNEWVYISLKFTTFPVGTKSLQFFNRPWGLSKPLLDLGKIDMLGFTFLKNAAFITPTYAYPTTIADIPKSLEQVTVEVETMQSEVDVLNNTVGTNKSINIKNSDSIVICGDSYTQGVYNPKNKAYINYLSMLTDYRIENFSQSGNGNHEIVERIRSNTPRYHSSLGIKDYGSKYAILMSYTNEKHTTEISLEYYLDLVRNTAETVKSLGMIPIISTEWLAVNPQAEIGLKRLADEYGCLFIDIINNRRKFYTIDYAPFIGEGHPGVRVNALLYEPMKKALDTLPRPKQGIKIFRKRTEFTVSEINDLLCDTIPQRAKAFKEISVGHGCLVDEQVKYYDSLNTVGTFQRDNLVFSEYLMLQNKENVSFSDYALVEIITPSTSRGMNDFNLHLSDPSVTVYARNMFSGDYESAGGTFFIGFKYSGTPTVSVGDTYTSNDTDADMVGKTFTVFAIYNGMIICSPGTWDTSNHGAGILTKTGGAGGSSASITYASTTYAENPLWYEQFGKAKGRYTEITGVDGVYTIASADMNKYMNYDKFQFLLYKSGGFTLSDIYATYSGTDDKVYTQKQSADDISGTEVLTQPLVGTAQISGWTLTGSCVPYATNDTGLPYGTTQVIDVTPTDYIKQNLSYTQETSKLRKMQIKVWARIFPAIFASTGDLATAPITEDTFDLGTLGVELLSSGYTVPQEFTELVGLHWKEITINTIVPTFTAAASIKVSSKDKTIQIAKVSVKIEP